MAVVARRTPAIRSGVFSRLGVDEVVVLYLLRYW